MNDGTAVPAVGIPTSPQRCPLTVTTFEPIFFFFSSTINTSHFSNAQRWVRVQLRLN